VVIRNQETKDKIFEIVGQEYVKQAAALIIPANDSEKSMLPDRDIAVASENMFLQATALGLGTVWKHLTPEWTEKIKSLLKIPEKFAIINVIPVGYPKTQPEPHTDQDFSPEKIHQENW
jgi:nitroreductase